MLKKEELISSLQEALRTEEAAIPLYTKFVGSTLFLSGFSEENISRIERILHELNKDSCQHAAKFERLISQIENGDKDAY
ncbi:MAG: hypothetical protein JW912_04300 [Sedimentisphaerales bacterium]|nr:hypothetical protein [Sedimentisphaerales bacterium]